ncbi:MAG: hypothetical protein M1812_001267 [Candelaria pacifica]|nr:MAG: hypothetical protein M1812_001267 [Candelaria pacifica]
MGLVNYSDSEGSEAENTSIKVENQSRPGASKASFQKVVDRSNPHKIRVTLPQASSAEPKNESSADEPPLKRARTNGGTFSSFNSFLPAPKRVVLGGSEGTAGKSKGLGSGVNLKTGAAPGFSRNAEPEVPSVDETSVAEHGEASHGGDTAGKDIIEEPPLGTVISQKTKVEPKKVGTVMMFKPLSVVRKPQKKKPAAVPHPVALKAPTLETAKGSKSKTKVSLFSMDGEPTSSTETPASTNGEYMPMVFEPPQQNAKDHSYPPSEDQDHLNGDQDTYPNIVNDEVLSAPDTQSLDTIAADLNLSKSARRQLFGRQGNSTASAANIINFNTDQEYASNEALRAAGENVQHNPVKAIAPGKHNLKQLVNAASNQKDALEEHFASGKRNKKEAGSKYGW